jgi:hypothetical protein
LSKVEAISVSIRIGRIALAFLVLAVAAGSVAIPAGAEHGGAVVAKSKCKKKKTKRAATAKKKKKCKRGGAGGAATSLPGQATHPNVTPTVTTPTTPARQVSSVSVVDNPILGGRSTQGQVTINGIAPSEGQPVELKSSTPTVSVPSLVQVAQGQTTASFSVGTTEGSDVTATVTASIGASSKQVVLNVVDEPSVKSVTLAYHCFPDVGLLNFGTNRVTLDVPADVESSVGLLSSNTSYLTVPSAVNVQAGSSSATFGVNTIATVLSPPGVTVAGSLGSSNVPSAPSSIRDDSSDPQVVAGVSAPATVPRGSSVQGTVNLDCEAPLDGTQVTLSSDTSGVTVSPSPMVVLEGALSETFTVGVEADVDIGTVVHIGETPLDPSSPRATLTIVDDIQIQ